MGKLKKFIALVACVVIVMGMSLTVFGAYAHVQSTTNYVSTAQFGSQIIEKYDPPEYVQPDTYIVKEVNIKNVGNAPSLVRVKLIREFDRAGLNPEMILLDLDTENWVEKDGWYYYRNILEGGESTTHPLLKGFTLSEEADSEYRSVDGHIRVVAESLQYAGNFVEEAWGTSYAEIGVSEPKPERSVGKTEVVFTGKKFKFNNKGKDDLFANFKVLYPGSTRTQVITVKNESKNTETIDLTYMFSKDSADMLKDLMFKFVRVELKTKGGDLLYSGFIGGKDAGKSISLGEYKPGQSRDIIISAVVDGKLDTGYQNLKGSVDWSFGVHPQPENNTGGDGEGSGNGSGGSGSEGNGFGNGSGSGSGSGSTITSKYFAKTGDNQFFLYFGVGTVMLGCVMLYVSTKKNRGLS